MRNLLARRTNNIFGGIDKSLALKIASFPIFRTHKDGYQSIKKGMLFPAIEVAQIFKETIDNIADIDLNVRALLAAAKIPLCAENEFYVEIIARIENFIAFLTL